MEQRTSKKQKKRKSKNARKPCSEAHLVEASNTTDSQTPIAGTSQSESPTGALQAEASKPTESQTLIAGTSQSESPSDNKRLTNQTARQRKPKTHPNNNLGVNKCLTVPARPDGGRISGTPVKILCNCFNMTFKSVPVRMYDLKKLDVSTLGGDGTKKLVPANSKEIRIYMQEALRSSMPHVIYDGGLILFSLSPLDPKSDEKFELRFEIDDPNQVRKLYLHCSLTRAKIFDLNKILAYLSNPNASILQLPQDAISILDCILNDAFKTNYVSMGRNALFESTPYSVLNESMLQIHRGYFTSVRPQWKIRIIVDLSFKAFLVPGNVADVLYGKYGKAMNSSIQAMERDVKHVSVQACEEYAKQLGYPRRYKIHGISSQGANKLIIQDINQTVEEYFADKYKINLKYPDLPCVKVNRDREVYIPMELLDILPFQESRLIRAEVAAAIIRVAAVKPNDRFKGIQQFLHGVLRDRHDIFERFGINVDKRPTETTALMIKPPVANFGGVDTPLNRGFWPVPRFHTPASGEAIQTIVFVVPGKSAVYSVVKQNLEHEGRKFGLEFNVNDGGALKAFQVNAKLKRALEQGYALAILVLRDTNSYYEIKRNGDLLLGMPTQCVKETTLDKRGIWPNLLLKINCKLGGVNWTIPSLLNSRPNESSERFIVFGADVTHPPPGQSSNNLRYSVAAVTASYTPDLARYAAVVCQQATSCSDTRTTREIIDNLESMVEELLKCYMHENGRKFPTCLIFYRDGVSDGQFEILLVEELCAIQRACLKFANEKPPLITYIVVKKRHRLRFMPANLPSDGKKTNGNIEPGTVIDKDVVHHRDFDFFLSSAIGIQGTVKPAYYRVLYDDSSWSSEELQNFSFYLCHNYMRCSRSVSYPSPTYYAHLAAYRARAWLSDTPSLANNMFDKASNQFRIHPKQFLKMFFV